MFKPTNINSGKKKKNKLGRKFRIKNAFYKIYPKTDAFSLGFLDM